ncbi:MULTISPECIES: RHS repeat domain-containing protein [unclassified Streptomyces]|uniref:RHS repeat domain-containing protein n=1 Tax=unclassified Streptomyces TaxID=2593676 RepID=UPI0035D59FF6
MRHRRRLLRGVAVTVVGYLAISMLTEPVAAAADLALRELSKPDPVPTAPVEAHKLNRPDQTAQNAWKGAPKVTWPKPGSSTVSLPGAGLAKTGDPSVRVGKSARTSQTGKAATLAQAQVQVLDQDAAKAVGVDGVVLAVRSADGSAGPVDVQVDYSGFRHAYGGDWASRLTLRQLPACALSTPDKAACTKSTSLPTRNDTNKATVAAAVNLPAAAGKTAGSNPVSKAPSARSGSGLTASEGTVLLAVAAAASGASGDFKATPLSPSAAWTAGGSSGGFTWSYDLDTPAVAAGQGPGLSLAYSSQAIDGRTAATNNQANWVGDGWSLDVGSIERRYVSCSEDTTNSNGTDKSGDQCWKKDNAVLTLGGQSNVLIKDDDTGKWHLEDDDGTKVEKLTDTARANGDNDGEYWRVTLPDGTQYYFGYNRLPGWSSGKTETNSTWTVPVFGNQSGEPCHASAYKDSWCQQAWRWNLDYVVTPHGDASAYYWKAEENYYGLNVNPSTGASTATAYDRGGYLDHIDYGLRDNNTLYTQKAAGKVDFTVDERCLSDCGTFDSAHAKNWPDVPFDRYCASGKECKDRYSPSFWTRQRLTQVDTSILTGGAYKPVDTWKLTHQFPATGDGTDRALWLASLTRTGHTGTGDIQMPTVTFKGQQLPNRVEGATTGGAPDPVPPMTRYRVYAINTETGSTIGATYSPADCKAGDVPSPASNKRRCYPVIWSPPDAPAADYEPYLDWFHTYVVTQILESDNTGGAPAKETDYSYLDGMAWGKDEDEFTKSAHRTYGDRKGYGRVQVRTGAPAQGKQSLEEHRYFRGISGAKVADHEGTDVTDHPAFAGMPREDAVFSGDGGTLQQTTSYTPWRSTATATQARTGLSALQAYATGTAQDKSRTAVGTGWRASQTVRTFDRYGQVLTESDLGDLAKSGDEECTTTTYAASSTGILDLPKQVKNVTVACDKTPTLPKDLISDARYYYDGATSLDTAATKGDVTRLDEQDAKGTGSLTTARHTYDQHGRELTDTNAANLTSTTAYSPATLEAPTSKTETNTLKHAVTTTYDPTRSAVTAVTDANGKRTDAVLDGLGRTLKVWRPGWAKADHADQPSTEYTYTVSQTAPNAVATKTLQHDGTYTTSFQIYDGLLRERETQAPAVGTADRLITETRYDTRGLASKTYSAYYADGAPSTTLVTAIDSAVPAMVENLYDGQGRVTDAIARHNGDEAYRTKTLYGGDRTTVIPPSGGTATTTITDVQGRTTELLQYTNADRTQHQSTRYTYGKYDEPDTVTDPAGNTWTYTFDARGQKTDADDPDKGKTHTTYDTLGRATTVTDARGITLTSGYDDLGRQRTLKKGSTLLAEWTYDTVAKGQLTSSTRYIDGKAYTTATTAYNDAYQPTASTVTIPTDAGALAGSYTWTFGYNAYTGAQEWIKHPAVGNLPSERQTTIYGDQDLPLKTTAGAVSLVNATQYDVFSRVNRLEFGTLGKKLYLSRDYDEFTGRLTRQTSDRDLAPKRIDDTTYTYDDAGNVTGLTTASGQDAQKTTDSQCFTNDALQRLTEAWTTTTDCSAKPGSSTVGGPDPYWQTFTYDTVGNRTKLVDHSTNPTTTTDATTSYTHNTPGSSVPHAPQTTTTSGGPDNGQTSAFTYDDAGNTKTRTIGSHTQNLTWDDEGHLATVTEADKTTSYHYDADGNRMIARDADGTQTLTLPGNNELKITPAGTKEGVRYYTHGDETIAVRTSTGFSFLINDHQGTAMTAVAMTTLAVTRRRQLPFGQLRSEQSETMPGTRGFVSGTEDPTGLTHLGAREYDPTLGTFISVDPLIDIDDPLQMNAYAYANSRPITASDPDGKMIYDDFTGLGYGNTKSMRHAYEKWGYRDSSGRTTQKYRNKLASLNKSYSTYYKSSYYKRLMREAARAEAAAQAAARKKAAEAARRKQEGIRGSIMRWALDHMSDDQKIAAYTLKQGGEFLWKHGYVSFTGCLMVCANVGFQNGTTNFGITGGMTFGGSKGIVNGSAGRFLGMSVGINSATPDDQAFQLANVTVADGFVGGNAAVGRRKSGGNYYQAGWAGGMGYALQGPVTLGGTWSPSGGLSWIPYSD